MHRMVEQLHRFLTLQCSEDFIHHMLATIAIMVIMTYLTLFTEVCMDMDTMDIIVMDIHHISIPQIPWVTGQLSLWEKEKKESLEEIVCREAQQC